MIKALSIVWYKVLPAKYGGQKGIAGFNKYLGRKIQLACLCSDNNESDPSLSYQLIPMLPKSKWQFLNPLVWRKIKQQAAKYNPSHIILEHPYHFIAGKRAAKIAGAVLVIHSHNIEYLRFRVQKKWWWRLLYYYERWGHRKAGLNLFKTAGDLAHAVNTFRLDPAKCIVIPYGIDPEEKKTLKETARQIICNRHRIGAQDKILLFAATLDYQPNADAVSFISKEIAPMLEKNKIAGKIVICGRNKTKKFQYLHRLSHPLVIQAGEVDDIENYFAAADLFINPVMTGGGIQTKNIDALNYNLSVVGFENMFTDMEDTLCKGKIFKAAAGNKQHFYEQIVAALSNAPLATPPAFYEYHSLAIQAEKLAARLNSK